MGNVKSPVGYYTKVQRIRGLKLKAHAAYALGDITEGQFKRKLASLDKRLAELDSDMRAETRAALLEAGMK